MKWPDDLDFGEEVYVITREFIQDADPAGLALSNGDVFAPDSPELICVFRPPPVDE